MIQLSVNEKEKQQILRALEIYAEEFEAASNAVFSGTLKRGFASDAEEITALRRRLADVFDLANLDNEVLKLIRQDQFINAIKLCRQQTGLGLKEAKEYVEKVRDKAKSRFAS